MPPKFGEPWPTTQHKSLTLTACTAFGGSGLHIDAVSALNNV